MDKLFGENGVFRPYIGCDESGKGDYFGPLVVAAAAVETAAELGRLVELGARDSKKVGDARAETLAGDIKRAVRTRSLTLEPERYNELYDELGNLNQILAWAYAQVIDGLAAEASSCELVVVDKFGDEGYLQTAASAVGAEYGLYQVTGAEEYPAVAAASIIARAEFLRGLKSLSADLGFDLPKGATDVINVGRLIAEEFGSAKLDEVAKLHFKTTRQILDS
ncbi:MAG: ribonuclease HIII [Candidatus Coatesbacteria bacterium]|nr:MAG: ribonuclease HIII [Candidatus Coatesbacteria bacterium]